MILQNTNMGAFTKTHELNRSMVTTTNTMTLPIHEMHMATL